MKNPFGPVLLPGGQVQFRFWAPAHGKIGLAIEGEPVQAMRPVAEGWHELTRPAAAGTLYRFVLPDGTRVPDPASRFQPQDVDGPSEIIDPSAYQWHDAAWRGRPWNETVLYELHIGTFTPEGTFRAAISRLDYLRETGVTAVEIMPIADFPGQRNWGYDGALPYAPDSAYGRPQDLKAFVDAAHLRGLMVFLDVVYNHFGPDGNFLPSYAPDFFTDRHKTPWGAAINYDGQASQFVRAFFIGNALYWLQEFHLDGLRLDAVHAIIDDSKKHFLTELAETVRAAIPRPVHLILENEENSARRLVHEYTAQWNDDVHHVLHVAATGEETGYYVAYKDDTEKLGRALAEGFAFQGETMAYRNAPRGEPSAALPPSAFVAFIQNHDQIGNRAFGDRLSATVSPEAMRAIAATYLLLPQIPMIFMGEEFAATQPFPFFCDFSGDLAEAVRQGRREEFARFPEFQDPSMREKIPDPEAEQTFLSAKLDWSEATASSTRDWYHRILAVRFRVIVPLLNNIGHGGGWEVLGPSAVGVQWGVPGVGVLSLMANLSSQPVPLSTPPSGEAFWQEGDVMAPEALGPWAVRWSLGRA